ncbi:cyclin family protein [Nocardiopsis nanhaiensis]
MVDWLTMAIQMVSLGMAVWCLISTFRDQPMLIPHLVGMTVLWLLVLAQVAATIVAMGGGERPDEMVMFVSYLATVALLPPACAAWGFMERSKWGPAVIAFACLILPVLLVRIEQLWSPVA